MKGCLKMHPTSTSTPQSDGSSPCRGKSVSFERDAVLETVFIADEWDRSPMEPSRKLSYQDLLELKEIQRDLPRANQPPDYYAGRAAKHYLKGVPIGLLPLLPASDSSSHPSPLRSRLATGSASGRSPSPQRRYNPVFQPPPTSNLHPSNLNRQKPHFAFLPLLDSTTTEQTSPMLRPARSRSPSPARFNLPSPSLTTVSSPTPHVMVPPTTNPQTYLDDDEDSFPRNLTSAMQILEQSSEPCHTSSFGRSNPAFKPAYTVPQQPSAPVRPKRQRNVIFVNGVEIDLDGSDDEDEDKEDNHPRASTPTCDAEPTIKSTGSNSPSSITFNGLPTPPPSTSPSPTLTQRIPLPPVEPDLPFVGLHAPVVFKRKIPAPLSTSPQRCSQQNGQTLGQRVESGLLARV